MKTRPFLLLAVATLACSTAFADAKFSKYTADYYKGAYDLYEGKEITLKVAFVKPYAYKSNISDIRFFHAVTRDETKDMNGGDIAVAVPIDGGDDLIRRFGTAPSKEGKTRILKGILRADGLGLWYLDVNGSISKKLDARRQKEMATPTPSPTASPTATPETSETPKPEHGKKPSHPDKSGNSPKTERTPADTNSGQGAEPLRPWWKVW